MFFSIVIPVYNVEKYLPKCLESILIQNFSDYELILVDDGSTDRSGYLCDSYKDKFDHINVLHQENAGQACARNAGTALASGEYIIYLDSDDFILSKNFLQDIYSKIQYKHSDVVMYKFCKYFDEKSEPEKCTFTMANAEMLDDTEEILKDLVRNDAFYSAPWLKAIRRGLLVENNIEFEPGLTGEDMEWMCHMMTCINSVSIIDKPYVAYRQRSGSISRSNNIKSLTDYIYLMKKWIGGGYGSAHISDQRREAFNGAMAKLYSNLLICYTRTVDSKKKEYYSDLKEMRYLLKYGMSTRPKILNIVCNLVGLRGTLVLLAVLDRVT